MESDRTVAIHGDQWKWRDIEEDVEWCRTRQWEQKPWTPDETRGLRDGISAHDHCQICQWTLMESPDPEVSVGYKSGRQLWICTECYEKFIASGTPKT